ncbi:hypothetical protein FRC11_011153 [Ceratobasidium sp. 423]|nr:hypothetical protein FRC11_011153 [Ceratobasidium sp. 423]
MKNIDEKALQINELVKNAIAEGAAELDIDEGELMSRFALIAPLSETRRPNYYNGLISHYSKEWKSEYDGPPKQYLSYVVQRINRENLAENLSDEEIERYVKVAEEARASNKELQAARTTRKKAVSRAFAELQTIHERLLTLNNTVGVEFVLFVTRGALEDDVEPFYSSSEKAAKFMHGQVSMAPKDILQLMDLYVIGDGQGAEDIANGERNLHRRSVQDKLRDSLLKAAKGTGADTSKFRHVQYKQYAELVLKYKVILRGYPLTPDGGMVRPSDFPGGIKGLRHAERQLTTGHWGFDKIDETIYNEWKARYEAAKENDEPTPVPPHIEVTGSEYKKKEQVTDTGPTKRKLNTKKTGTKRRRNDNPKQKAGRTVKSRETIEDESDIEEEVVRGDTDKEATESESD